MFKPDALWHGFEEIEDTAHKAFAQNGLRVYKILTVTVTKQFVLNLWPHVSSEILLERIFDIEHMQLPVWIIEGDQAVEKTLDIKYALRQIAQAQGWYDNYFKVCHSPDTPENFFREWEVIFPDEPLP